MTPQMTRELLPPSPQMGLVYIQATVVAIVGTDD
jgi:hypothetical protein